jgi:N-acetylglucosaminyl-diphospho-decaprenol L-rhamnosyltransferase
VGGAIVQAYYGRHRVRPRSAATVYRVPVAAGEGGNDTLVSVVVVTHNNGQLIGPCLDAIYGSVPTGRAEVIVVDNASTDLTRAVISEGSWPVTVLPLEENVGFARAVNYARERAHGRFVALVNSDAFPDPACIERLVARLQQSPRVGIVGARLRYPSGRLHPSGGTFPSLLGGLWVALALHRVPGLSRLGIGYLADERLYRRARRVDWVCAAVCAARLEVGPLPTSSFMYGEDVGWGLASSDNRLEVWLEPAATAVHIGRASVDESRDPGFAQRQRVQFELAWYARQGGLATLAARCVLCLHAVVRMAVYGGLTILRGRPDPRLPEYAALMRAAIASRTPAV